MNLIEFKLITIFMIIFYCHLNQNLVNCQNDQCKTVSNENGQCIVLQNCESLYVMYSKLPRTRDVINYMIQSQTLCGSRSLNRQPIICCPIKIAISSSSSQIKGKLLTIDEGCGFSNVSHSKIVGGEPAELGAWPWMALLGYTNTFDEIEWKCGGTLITSRHILTAAHCIKSSLTTVRLGEHNILSDTETNIIDVSVKKMDKYSLYNQRDGNGDIAILHLNNDVDFTDTIKPICIPISEPARSTNYIGYQPFIAGWGRTQENGNTSSILMELQIPILRNVDCQERYQRIGKLISEQQFNNNVICAGILTGGKDSCQGDSGGPLMIAAYVNRKTIYYQIGVISYGIGCAHTDVPSVYTNVPKFIDWILEKVNNE